jgi:MFS transporter, DHA1 family, inner membrane transport protein
MRAASEPTTDTHRTKSAHVGRRIALWSLFLGAVAVGTDGFMIAGLLPRIAHSFQSSTAVAAQLVTVFAVTYALGAPVLALAFERADRRALLIGALGALALTNALAALAPLLMLLFVARFAAALAASVYTPNAAVIAAGLVSAQRRGRALAVVPAGLTVSIVTGVPLGALVGQHLGWRATFVGVAVVSAAVALVAGLAAPRVPGSPAASLRERVGMLRTRGVGRVLITTLAGYLAYTYLAPISEHAGARGGGALAGVLASFGVGAAAGALLSGVGVNRYGQHTVIRTAAGTQALALAILGSLDLASAHVGTIPVALAFLLLGAGSFDYDAPQQHRLLELAPASATTLVSLNSSAIYAGIGLSGALGGLTLQAGPAANCLTGAALALLAGLVVGPVRALRTRGAPRWLPVVMRRHPWACRPIPNVERRRC